MLEKNKEPKAQKTIYSRLVEFQSKLPAINKDANNPFYKSKYATLDSIQKTIQPILAECGLSYIQPVSSEGMQTILYSVDGEKIESGFYPVSVSGKAQEIGSAVTYARRYSLCSFLGLIVGDEDDDGNKANDQNPPVKTEWLTQDQFNKLKYMVENKTNIDGVKATIKKFSGEVIDGVKYAMKREYKETLTNMLNV